MMRRFSGSTGVVLALAAAVSVAHAENRPTLLADHRPNAPNAAIEFELGYRFYTDDLGTAHSLVPSIDFRYAFSQHAELVLDWPLAFAAYSPKMGRGDSSFKSGDPAAALYYVGHVDNGYFRVGGGVAFPVAHIGANGSAAPYEYALAMNGLYDPYRYAPDTLSLLIPARLEVHNDALVLGSEAAMILLIPTGDQRNDTDLQIQFAGWIGGKFSNTTIGARMQLAWLATANGDNTQLALVPFVQGDFASGGFVYARLLLNLDSPYGVFADGIGSLRHVWAFYLGGGTRF